MCYLWLISYDVLFTITLSELFMIMYCVLCVSYYWWLMMYEYMFKYWLCMMCYAVDEIYDVRLVIIYSVFPMHGWRLSMICYVLCIIDYVRLIIDYVLQIVYYLLRVCLICYVLCVRCMISVSFILYCLWFVIHYVWIMTDDVLWLISHIWCVNYYVLCMV